jgi:hypothetical protein
MHDIFPPFIQNIWYIFDICFSRKIYLTMVIRRSNNDKSVEKIYIYIQYTVACIMTSVTFIFRFIFFSFKCFHVNVMNFFFHNPYVYRWVLYECMTFHKVPQRYVCVLNGKFHVTHSSTIGNSTKVITESDASLFR